MENAIAPTQLARELAQKIVEMMDAWTAEKTGGTFQRMPDNSMYALMVKEVLDELGVACNVRLMERFASFSARSNVISKFETVYLFSVGDEWWDIGGSTQWQSDVRSVERIRENLPSHNKGVDADWTIVPYSDWTEVPLGGVFNSAQSGVQPMEAWAALRGMLLSHIQSDMLKERAVEAGFENAPARRGPRI